MACSEKVLQCLQSTPYAKHIKQVNRIFAVAEGEVQVYNLEGAVLQEWRFGMEIDLKSPSPSFSSNKNSNSNSDREFSNA